MSLREASVNLGRLSLHDCLAPFRTSHKNPFSYLQQETSVKSRAGLRKLGDLADRNGMYQPLLKRVLDQILLPGAPMNDDWQHQVRHPLFRVFRPPPCSVPFQGVTASLLTRLAFSNVLKRSAMTCTDDGDEEHGG